MRVGLYLIPALGWLLAVNLLFKPANSGEFFFAGVWMLVPLAVIYGLWIPLVEFLANRSVARQEREGRMIASAPALVDAALQAYRGGNQFGEACPDCNEAIRLSSSEAGGQTLVRVSCRCGLCNGQFSVARDSA